MSRIVIAIVQPLSKSLVILHINQRKGCAETIGRVGFCQLFCQYLTGFVHLRLKSCGAIVRIALFNRLVPQKASNFFASSYC
jgi:hypothetical protein